MPAVSEIEQDALEKRDKVYFGLVRSRDSFLPKEATFISGTIILGLITLITQEWQAVGTLTVAMAILTGTMALNHWRRMRSHKRELNNAEQVITLARRTTEMIREDDFIERLSVN